MKIEMTREEATELYLFMSAMMLEYFRKPISTMYQLYHLTECIKKIERALDED